VRVKSFWSISDTTFKLSTLAAVVPAVSLCTYVIVLNLDKIIRFFLPMQISKSGSPFAAQSMSSSPIEYFVNSQIRRMQQDASQVWNQRGHDFDKFKVFGKSKSRPSQWRIVQFALGGAVHKLWGALIIIISIIPQTMKRLRGRPEKPDIPFISESLGHLGDVRVKVHVDVNEEDI